MLSTISNMERAAQEADEAEASVPLNPHPNKAARQNDVPCWSLFDKPILAILIGGVLFGSGTALSLLYFTQVGNVPYLLGPLCLSVGLMFLVTGLVWVPVVKQKLEHKALTTVNQGKAVQLEHEQR